jgi:hypothetical protein
MKDLVFSEYKNMMVFHSVNFKKPKLANEIQVYVAYNNTIHGITELNPETGILVFDINKFYEVNDEVPFRSRVYDFNINTKNITNPNGQDIFHALMQKNLEYHKIKGIQCKWMLDEEYYPTRNLEQFIENLNNYSTYEENARNTWSGKMLSQYGFTNISKIETEPPFKRDFYEQVNVLFTK